MHTLAFAVKQQNVVVLLQFANLLRNGRLRMAKRFRST
jgi:hypothetical protein